MLATWRQRRDALQGNIEPKVQRKGLTTKPDPKIPLLVKASVWTGIMQNGKKNHRSLNEEQIFGQPNWQLAGTVAAKRN